MDTVLAAVIHLFVFIGYVLSLVAIVLAALFVAFGKIQMWLGLAFMPFAIVAWLLDRGQFLMRLLAFSLTGMGTFVIAALIVQSSAEAYANAISDLVTSQINNARAAGGASAAASAAEQLTFADVMIAAFSILYAVFLMIVLTSVRAWARGIFGGLVYDSMGSSTIGRAAGKAAADAVKKWSARAWRRLTNAFRPPPR